MARTKEFDKEQALDAAIGVFREHGFDGTSTDMLVRAMKIGRQSLYDTFGDKWKLYCLAVERYSTEETNAHLVMLRNEPRAVDSIRAMMERVVENSRSRPASASVRFASSARADLNSQTFIKPLTDV